MFPSLVTPVADFLGAHDFFAIRDGGFDESAGAFDNTSLAQISEYRIFALFSLRVFAIDDLPLYPTLFAETSIDRAQGGGNWLSALQEPSVCTPQDGAGSESEPLWRYARYGVQTLNTEHGAQSTENGGRNIEHNVAPYGARCPE